VTLLEKLRIRIADRSETGHILGAYERWGYGAGINPDDVVWVAEVGNELVGVVTIATENAVLVLRGMRVAVSVRQPVCIRDRLQTSDHVDFTKRLQVLDY
jgi:hypothetical protein